jgi:hypothetical protein
LIAVAPAMADDAALREEVQQLQKQVDALSAQTQTGLDQEVEEYLDTNPVWQNAQGGSKWDDVTVIFRITAIGLASVDSDDPPQGDGNFHLVFGDVDLDLAFNITENLRGFLNLNSSNIPSVQFDDILDDVALTASGATDGIGINGTVPVSSDSAAGGSRSTNSINVYEAGFEHTMTVGNNEVHVVMGKLDPRVRFGGTAFSNDENTQFQNNVFDDTSAILWLSDITGRQYLGLQLWTEFGGGKWRVDVAWFNTPGEWFSHGQFYVQVGYTGELKGRPMHVKFYAFVDEFFLDDTGDGSSGGGVAWDWQANDKIGVFFTITGTGGDVNPIDLDATIGLQWTGAFDSRPDDVIGIAVGWISLDDGAIQNARDGGRVAYPTAFVEDVEITVELYYNAMYEGGKYQVTPFVQFIQDPTPIVEDFAPGGQDSLVILGVRFFVFF